jgi:hypothetical protein
MPWFFFQLFIVKPEDFLYQISFGITSLEEYCLALSWQVSEQ